LNGGDEPGVVGITQRELLMETVKHHLAKARSSVGAETTAQLVWILAARLPEPEGVTPRDE
jgi:hypothetical protein